MESTEALASLASASRLASLQHPAISSHAFDAGGACRPSVNRWPLSGLLPSSSPSPSSPPSFCLSSLQAAFLPSAVSSATSLCQLPHPSPPSSSLSSAFAFCSPYAFALPSSHSPAHPASSLASPSRPLFAAPQVASSTVSRPTLSVPGLPLSSLAPWPGAGAPGSLWPALASTPPQGASMFPSPLGLSLPPSACPSADARASSRCWLPSAVPRLSTPLAPSCRAASSWSRLLLDAAHPRRAFASFASPPVHPGHTTVSSSSLPGFQARSRAFSAAGTSSSPAVSEFVKTKAGFELLSSQAAAGAACAERQAEIPGSRAAPPRDASPPSPRAAVSSAASGGRCAEAGCGGPVAGGAEEGEKAEKGHSLTGTGNSLAEQIERALAAEACQSEPDEGQRKKRRLELAALAGSPEVASPAEGINRYGGRVSHFSRREENNGQARRSLFLMWHTLLRPESSRGSDAEADGEKAQQRSASRGRGDAGGEDARQTERDASGAEAGAGDAEERETPERRQGREEEESEPSCLLPLWMVDLISTELAKQNAGAGGGAAQDSAENPLPENRRKIQSLPTDAPQASPPDVGAATSQHLVSLCSDAVTHAKRERLGSARVSESPETGSFSRGARAEGRDAGAASECLDIPADERLWSRVAAATGLSVRLCCRAWRASLDERNFLSETRERNDETLLVRESRKGWPPRAP
ncbi:hypothetical protein BESB_061090 [Besnoitia besnoiti]|uniref:F-box domain-containing protein n=1 Tax=Besnoitia besnoiti TaxID=94643 RepID=A0A2A9MIK3_BESBE|nr:hypothetical protein BESB_061090 [Besnoitia besnoiti]PFH35222.1 hypothetical protein BESB_061090 [Besnoitia besnoiti]